LFELQSKYKRQIEILGLVLSGSYSSFDLAALFNVEELTIKRDLNELRSYGIDIHSRKNEGVIISSPIPKEKLLTTISFYLNICRGEVNIDKSINLLIDKFNLKILSNIVLLQRCIEGAECAVIDYNKSGEAVEKDKVIEPLFIFQNDGYWRLVINGEENVKQLLIDKILTVTPGGKKFNVCSSGFGDPLKYAWKSWFGNEVFKVKLWLSPFWAERLMPRSLVADQTICMQEDGSAIFECSVNSLNEIAGWIVSRGEGVKVIEPEALKMQVISLAEGALQNYIKEVGLT
jgi:predicted DNA-binding transcriptional regulator YafY